MSSFTSFTILGTGIILLAGFSVWVTKTAWPLLILLFFAGAKVNDDGKVGGDDEIPD